MAYKFYKTKTVDLEPFGLEGKLEVRGLYQGVMNALTERLDAEGIIPDSPRAQLVSSIIICKMCIVSAPFDITEENIAQLPMEVITEIISTVSPLQKEIPLD